MKTKLCVAAIAAIYILGVGQVMRGHAQDIKIPERIEMIEVKNNRVHDYVNSMTWSDRKMLNVKSVTTQGKTGVITVMAVVKDLGGMSIEEYAMDAFRKWGVGSKKEDNGLLILIAVKERKVRIETGYGTEGVLPDMTTRQIVDSLMLPELKKGDFFRAFAVALDGIEAYSLKNFRGG